nr:glutaredoxin family protein [Lottiidibacillus patelloidae]
MKEFLSHHNVSYVEYDVSTDTAARDKMVFTYEAMSTPTIVYKDKVLRGFSKETARELENLFGDK